MSALVHTVMRSRVLLLLVVMAASAPAAGRPDAAIDTIERASGAGDYPKALRLSAELLARDEAGGSRIGALLARMDVLVDAGEWASRSAELHAAIAALPDADARAAMEASFAANDASVTNNIPMLFETARKGLDAHAAIPETFAAEMHGALAKALLQQGKLEAARAEAQASIDIWRPRPEVRARRAEIALDLFLSQLAQSQGESVTALQHAEKASAIAIAAFGPASVARVHAEDQRAAVLEAMDRFPEARELRETMLGIMREHYGEHHLRTALAEGALGAHLQRTGNYAPAHEHYARAEAIMDSLADVGVRDRLVLANNYANLLQESGDEDAAFEHYHVALGLAADDRTRAMILTNIGNTEFRLQRYDKAIADFEEALPLREKAEGKDSPALSFALEGLGSSALALKRFDEAQRYFARAVELRGKNSAPNHSQLNVLNFGLALSYWGLGRDADALRLAVQTAERQQSLLNSLATGFSEQQSVAFDNLLVPATALVVTIAAEHGDAAAIAAAWRLVMIERGLIARAEARRLAIARASADAQLGQLYQDWRRANSELGDGWMSSRTSAAKMVELQAAADAAERALWAKLGYHQDDPANAAKPIAALQGALPDDGVLVAFTEGVGRDAARIVNAGAAQSAEDMYAFVLSPHAAPRLLRVGGIDAIAAQAHAWYQLLRDPRSAETALQRQGSDLRRDLLDGIGSLAGKRTLFVIPTGELFRVSFAALPAPQGGRYWIESGISVHTLSHESDLVGAAAPNTALKALLAGAPEFGAQAGKVDKSTKSVARLLCARAVEHGFAAIPGAARELDGLRTTLRGALGASGEVRVIDGAQATKERVLAALDGSEIVHLATHGFSFDETCGSDSARGMTLDRASNGAAPNAPPLSGLAFAGADVGSGHAPVGVLSAGELSAADLSHAAWVVLSACDSGLGPIGHTEGVFGMRRALRLAGARTVVMSLWEADDVATADLMQQLYRARFAEHRNVPDAMAQAMRQTLASRRAAQESTHPYYWAAFVSEGSWR